MINGMGYKYEPFQGSHEDQFFDWYITMNGMIGDGASQSEAIDYLRIMEAPEWVITRLLNEQVRKGD